MESSDDEAIGRRTAKFHPSPWGDFFLTHLFQTDEVVEEWNERIETLKPDVARKLLAPTSSSTMPEKLDLVDVVQRLGIGYHFEEEIQQLLQQVHHHNENVDYDDLKTVSLRFRLLRQHGLDVPSDIFKRFKAEDGGFKEELAKDVEGILSLYEAGYMRKQGEDILDEAIQFTKSHLNAAVILMDTELHSPSSQVLMAKRISHALERPLGKGVPKVEQLFFISVYEQMDGHDETLLTLAKLSFNVLQNMYQKELKALTKWWIDLDLIRRVKYARDKLIEIYFWTIGSMWEPRFGLARYTFTISNVLDSVFDDTYDAYGTIQELELFTAAILRWDTSMKGVNYKMKILFEAKLAVIDELDAITSKEGRSYCLRYVKLALQTLAKLYLEEARWFARKHVPSLDEYRQVSSLSTTYQSIVCATLCGLGELATKQVFDWIFSNPKILVASSDQCRLMDDIVSHKFEQERGHVASSVECHMTHYGISREEAVDALNKMVEDDWKIVNEELLNPQNRNIPKEVLSLFLRYEQMMDMLYKHSDGYTHSNTWTKDMLTALLVNPLPTN